VHAGPIEARHNPDGSAIHDVIRRLDPNLPISSLSSWQDSLEIMLLPSYAATAALAVFGALGSCSPLPHLRSRLLYGQSPHEGTGHSRCSGSFTRAGGARGAATTRNTARIWFIRGLVSGVLASRILASIVYQATPNDPLVLFGVALTMLLVGLLATWIPARRVFRVDPTTVLHDE